MREAGDVGHPQRRLGRTCGVAGEPEECANGDHRQEQAAGFFADGGGRVGPKAGGAGKYHAGDETEDWHAHILSGVAEDADRVVQRQLKPVVWGDAHHMV